MAGYFVSLVVGTILNMGIVLAFAPLCEGGLRKLTARIQSRQGPPVWQPYFDLLKLLGKEDLESGEVPAMQRFAACLSLGTTLTVAGFIPMGSTAPLTGVGDALLLVYLLTLCGVATLLAGLAAGSTYSLMGISREMLLMVTLEPLFILGVVLAAVRAQSFRLDEVFQGSLLTGPAFPWSGWLMLGVLLFGFQAYVGRVPFDIAEAETELMEGPLVEYSGPKLALFKYAHMAKLVIYSGLWVGLFVPWGNTWAFPLNYLLFLLKVALLVLTVTWVAATHARYRLDQAIRFFFALLGVGALALFLAVNGH